MEAESQSQLLTQRQSTIDPTLDQKLLLEKGPFYSGQPAALEIIRQVAAKYISIGVSGLDVL